MPPTAKERLMVLLSDRNWQMIEADIELWPVPERLRDAVKRASELLRIANDAIEQRDKETVSLWGPELNALVTEADQAMKHAAALWVNEIENVVL